MLLTLPFMAAIQIISATIGWQTRRGLAHNLAQQLPLPVLYGLVALLAVWLTPEVFIPHHRYAGYLKFLTLVLLGVCSHYLQHPSSLESRDRIDAGSCPCV